MKNWLERMEEALLNRGVDWKGRLAGDFRQSAGTVSTSVAV